MYDIDDNTFHSDFIHMAVKLKCLDCGAVFQVDGKWDNPKDHKDVSQKKLSIWRDRSINEKNMN